MKRSTVTINGVKLTEVTGAGAAWFATTKAVSQATGQKRFFINSSSKVARALPGWNCYSI